MAIFIGTIWLTTQAWSLEQPPSNTGLSAEMRMAREVLENPVRNQDPVQHLRACGTLASAEWAQQTQVIRQAAGVLSGIRLDGHDIAELATRRYDELMTMVERSRWRTLSPMDKDIAARWYLLREQNIDEADYLALRLYTGINPEARSAYYNEHCQ